MFGMKKYPIGFWNKSGIDDEPAKRVQMWKDLGITLGMTPYYKAEDKERVLALLDEAEKAGIKVIVDDYRATWWVLIDNGEDKYRELFAEAVADYGHHPAVFGFYVGDEPDAQYSAYAFKTMRIQKEIAPHLIAYLNILPWFDWIGERMGTPSLPPYLDRMIEEGNADLLSYDCYTQMWEGEKGYDTYFTNLRIHGESVMKTGKPFFNTVLSCGHYEYRCPSKNDMLWQLGSSVAHGAAGVMWYFIELHNDGILDSYRDAPINQFGERTEQFGWLSEVNRVFNNYIGEVVADLTIDKCYHVGKVYGGMPLFEPFGNVIDVKSKTPLVFSRFHGKDGGTYYIVCCNSPEKSAEVSMYFNKDINIERCNYGNKFAPVKMATDPIGKVEGEDKGRFISIWLAPGQVALFKEV